MSLLLLMKYAITAQSRSTCNGTKSSGLKIRTIIMLTSLKSFGISNNSFLRKNAENQIKQARGNKRRGLFCMNAVKSF